MNKIINLDGLRKFKEVLLTKLSDQFANVNHNHDDLYYTETEIDTKLGAKQSTSEKVTSIDSDSTDLQYPSAKAVYNLIGSGQETTDHKVTSIDANSTNIQYPSAKAVYDMVTTNEEITASALTDLNKNKAEKPNYVISTEGENSYVLDPNKHYILGTLAPGVEISLNDINDSKVNEWMFSFSTGSTVPVITWWTGTIFWQGGSMPTINPDKSYEANVIKHSNAYYALIVEF